MLHNTLNQITMKYAFSYYLSTEKSLKYLKIYLNISPQKPYKRQNRGGLLNSTRF